MKQVVLSLLLFLFSQSLHSQLSMRYNIGSIGNLGDLERKYSGPYYIPGNQCLWIANGIRTLFWPSKGSFLITCPVESQLLYILVYPNPASSTLNVRAVYSTIPVNAEQYIRIIDMSGEIRTVVKTNTIALRIGVKIPIMMLSRGYYAVNISNVPHSIQFIKN